MVQAGLELTGSLGQPQTCGTSPDSISQVLELPVRSTLHSAQSTNAEQIQVMQISNKFKKGKQPGVVAQAYNRSTGEPERRGLLQVQCQPGLQKTLSKKGRRKGRKEERERKKKQEKKNEGCLIQVPF